MGFDSIWEANRIEHRLSKPNQPRDNGQVERMNRAIKDATLKRHHWDSHDPLYAHFADFPDAHDSA